MGVLNCQKCINLENKRINELCLGQNDHKSRRVITALESQDTNSSPPKMAKYLNEEKINNSNFIDINKLKRIYSEIKKGNKDAIYDLDYNTLEIIYNESDSYYDFQEKESENKNYFNENNKDDNLEENVELHKYLKSKGNNDLDINDFINQKIKESQEAQIKVEGKDANIQNYEILDNPENYKIIYDKNSNCLQNNFLYNAFSDLELSEDENNNNINNKIIEEKEEYENDESSFKNTKTKEIRHYSANLTQKKIKDIDLNKIKKSVISEKIKNKTDISEKENLNHYKSINSNNNSINKQFIGKSITSYEVESDNNPNIENNNYIINNIDK